MRASEFITEKKQRKKTKVRQAGYGPGLYGGYGYFSNYGNSDSTSDSTSDAGGDGGGESIRENITPNTIHKLADRKGVKWDDEPSFLKLTKRLTGKEHLDDLDQTGLNKVKKHLDGLQGITEASYLGNIGMMEVAKFFNIATPKEKIIFKRLMNMGEKNKAWQLIQQVTGVKLQGKEFDLVAEDAITELFDPSSTFPVTWDTEFASQGEVHAVAYDKMSREINISFVPAGPDGMIEINFARGGSYDLTGKGDASKVLGTVAGAISQYVKKYQPQYLAFSAKENSRSSLYASMIRRMAVGYQLLPATQYSLKMKEYADIQSGQTFILATAGKQGVTESFGDTIPIVRQAKNAIRNIGVDKISPSVQLYRSPELKGAYVKSSKAIKDLPVTTVPISSLSMWEPESKLTGAEGREHVAQMVQAIKQGVKLPPITVTPLATGYRIVDGHHRYGAYKLAGVKNIPVRVVDRKKVLYVEKQGLAEGFIDYAQRKLGLKWGKIGDVVKGSVVAEYLNNQNDSMDTARYNKSKFKLVNITANEAEKYREISDLTGWPSDTPIEKVKGWNIDDHKMNRIRKNNVTYQSLMKYTPVVSLRGFIINGNHRIARALEMGIDPIPILKELPQGMAEGLK